jgi:hypothetical protein
LRLLKNIEDDDISEVQQQAIWQDRSLNSWPKATAAAAATTKPANALEEEVRHCINDTNIDQCFISFLSVQENYIRAK